MEILKRVPTESPLLRAAAVRDWFRPVDLDISSESAFLTEWCTKSPYGMEEWLLLPSVRREVLRSMTAAEVIQEVDRVNGYDATATVLRHMVNGTVRLYSLPFGERLIAKRLCADLFGAPAYKTLKVGDML